ncbi:MAG: AI-2E family transporter [Treponema sp.]|nr:AI-2E family transporter [Treponema sp.]
MTGREPIAHQIAYLLIFIATVLLFTVLKITADVIIPVLIAIMLSFVMLPIVRGMKKIRVPWALAVIVVTLFVIIFIVVVGTLIAISLKAIIEQYPKYELKFLSIYEFFANRLNLHFDAEKNFFYNIQTAFGDQINIGAFLRRAMISISTNMISIVRIIMVIILMFAFLLIEMSITSEKLKDAFTDGYMKGRMLGMIKHIMIQVMRFLSIKFFISLATGLLVYGESKIVKLDFAVVWAFLAFILNFIPTFGSIVSVIATSTFALLQFFPHPAPIMFVLLSTTLTNMMLGNIVEPRIQGHNLGISPFVILVMLSLWGWMWGFMGMIMAVPLTVVIKIICENVPLLHPVAILLGNRPQDTRKEFDAYDKMQETDNGTALSSEQPQ